LKRFSYYFAYLLLLLIPLQSFAAANMSICNALMQTSTQESMHNTMQNMPCHDSMSSHQQDANKPHQHSNCITNCATFCASLSAMTALPSNVIAVSFLATNVLVYLPQQVYASITQPNLQRPPIFLA
jgi:hypothetical protein